MPTKKTIDTIKDAKVREQAYELQALADSMNTAKSPEQKALEKALSKTEDKSTREFLEGRIAEIASDGVPEVDTVVSTIEDIGFNPVDVLRGGVQVVKDTLENGDPTKDSLVELARSMNTSKTPEERTLEDAIAKSTDEATIEFLKGRLSALASNSGMDVETAIDTLSDIGYDPIDVYRKGLLKKVANLVTWNNKEKKSKESK